MDTASQQPGKPPTGPQEDIQAGATASSSGGGLFRSWFPGWSGWYQSVPAAQPSVSPTSQPGLGASQFPAEGGTKLVTTYEEEAEIGRLLCVCVCVCVKGQVWINWEGIGDDLDQKH